MLDDEGGCPVFVGVVVVVMVGVGGFEQWMVVARFAVSATFSSACWALCLSQCFNCIVKSACFLPVC